MNPSALNRLHDALESTRYAAQFVDGIDIVSYRENVMVRSAVERQLEIIGEALGRARTEYSDLELLIPDLSRIIGLRHRLAHGYGDIDQEIIWSIVVDELPRLANRLEIILRESDTHSDG